MRKAARWSILLLVLGLPAPAGAAPKWVRVSFTANPASSMYVSWNDGPANPVVEYGLDTAYGQTANAVSEDAGGDIGVVYSAVLEGLQPDSLYHFRVGAAGDFSPDGTFRTAPADPCMPFTFAVAADNRPDFDWLPSGCWKQVYGKVAAEGPAFVFNSGDLVLDGAESGQWKDFLDDSEPWLVEVPLMACLGNHDDGPGEGDGANYNKLFAFPRNQVTGTEDFYSFDYGNVHFAALSTETFKEDSPVRYQRQRDWLADDLARTQKMWKVVFLHRPFYSFGLHGGNEDGQREPLLPVVDQYHVDLVIAGHDHIYERFGPLKNGEVVQSADEGTYYIVSGGGGAATVPPHRHHYVIISVANNVMHVRVQVAGTACLTIGTGGSGVTDEFDIVKTLTQDPCSGPQDADSDGFSPPADCCDSGSEPAPGCSAAAAASMHPGAQETCGDGIDQNCDGRDEPCACEDADRDGFPGRACGGDDCDDADASIRPDAIEICGDGKDNDCDDQTDEADCQLCADADGDGHFAIAGECPAGDDCDDADRLAYPGAAELCNQKDDNCDGATDEGGVCASCRDADGDGHQQKSADCPAGGDCDDNDSSIFPGAAETCNLKDDDCDGQTDEDLGQISCGIGACLVTSPACLDGQPVQCKPLDPPEPLERNCADGVDNDCDGFTDSEDNDCRAGSSGCGCATGQGRAGTLALVCLLLLLLRPGRRRSSVRVIGR